MHDLSDLTFFAAVIQHGGFTAAANAIGVQKSRLSRRVADLERQLGVRLLQRTTRSIALTEAGERFHARCLSALESVESAYESVAELRKEPTGTVRLACPVVMAQSYLAPVLPAYLAAHPKVRVFVEASDRVVSVIEERFDLVLRAGRKQDEDPSLVVKPMGMAQHILVASPGYLDKVGRPGDMQALAEMEIMARVNELHDGVAHWHLKSLNADEPQLVKALPRLVTSDLRVQMEAALNGVGVAFLPEPIVSGLILSKQLEHVLPDWVGDGHVVYMAYPPPRGMLPAVRSFIDYLSEHLPLRFQANPPVIG